MRWNQIALTESLSKYRPMFTALYPNGKVPRPVEMEIQKIERIMQREDRVVWMLRWYRFSLVAEMVSDFAQPSPEDRKMLDRAKRDLGNAKAWSDSAVLNEADRAYNYLDDFEHLWGMPIDAIKRFVFDRQLPTEIIGQFQELEQEWQDNISDRGVEIEHGDEKIIDFGNGWAWWHLPRSHCYDEGKAMGHCGNSASYKSDDTLLSLREHLHENIWEPHCTFILDGDGFLGEMKGKANEKPVERYHSMIVALLENDIVYGIKGGGYAPENNFALSDLSPDEVTRLKAMKPGLMTLNELISSGDLEGAEKSIKRMMHARGWTYRKIDMEKQNILLDEWSSIESFTDQHVYNYNRVFNDLRDELERMGDDDNMGDAIYNEFYNDYYGSVIENHVYDFNSYKCDDLGFSFDGVNGPVEMSISFYGIQQAFDPDEDNSSFRSGDDLDETDDWASFRDRDPTYDDDIDEAVSNLVAETGKFTYANAADLIYRTYARNVKGGLSSGSPTTNDPRQMRFDF